LRITLVATGLNSAEVQRRPKPVLQVMTQVRDGTTNQPVFVGGDTDEPAPAVFTQNSRRATVEAMKSTGMDEYDIPAFLRKQAD
jgi:cell division protein FtsZ